MFKELKFTAGGRRHFLLHNIRKHFTAIWTRTETILELFCYTLSPDNITQVKSRRTRWVGHVARTGQGRNVYRVLVGKPETKRPPERPRRRWEDGIKMNLWETGWGGSGVDSPGSG
jgi:hypothetical protein